MRPAEYERRAGVAPDALAKPVPDLSGARATLRRNCRSKRHRHCVTLMSGTNDTGRPIRCISHCSSFADPPAESRSLIAMVKEATARIKIGDVACPDQTPSRTSRRRVFRVPDRGAG